MKTGRTKGKRKNMILIFNYRKLITVNLKNNSMKTLNLDKIKNSIGAPMYKHISGLNEMQLLEMKRANVAERSNVANGLYGDPSYLLKLNYEFDLITYRLS